MQIKLEQAVTIEINGIQVTLSPKEFCKLQEDVTKFYNDNFWALQDNRE